MTTPGGKVYTEYSDQEGLGLVLKVVDKLHDEQSPYQRIEVYETTKFGRLLTLDGLVMLTGRDNFIYHEMMTHPALFTHHGPRRVLIIGGGDCGCLLEILKHPGVELAEQVELDERVTRVCEQFFPELCAANNDPRARLHFTDGIEWVARARAGTYDVIIIDSTDPVGQAARLFQAPFYADCHRALTDKGVLAVQSESPLLHQNLIRSIHTEMRQSGFKGTTTLQFAQCTYPSGWWSATLGTRSGNTGFRVQDARAKTFSTLYYNADIHLGALALPSFLDQALSRIP